MFNPKEINTARELQQVIYNTYGKEINLRWMAKTIDNCRYEGGNSFAVGSYDDSIGSRVCGLLTKIGVMKSKIITVDSKQYIQFYWSGNLKLYRNAIKYRNFLTESEKSFGEITCEFLPEEFGDMFSFEDLPL